jgi:hypothetical protein
MTEAEWLACDDPVLMLQQLRGKASDRRLRLFAVACCRRIREDGAEKSMHPAVVTSERFADGRVSARALKAARLRVGGVGAYSATASATSAVWAVTERAAADAARTTASHAADYRGHFAMEAGGHYWPAGQNVFIAARETEARAQTALLRDLLGNSLRPAPVIDPAWLSWTGGTVRKLAQAIYDGRAFDRLPVLADALEEAACADEQILAHCRSGGEHVRGCWVIDLLLGKE